MWVRVLLRARDCGVVDFVCRVRVGTLASASVFGPMYQCAPVRKACGLPMVTPDQSIAPLVIIDPRAVLVCSEEKRMQESANVIVAGGLLKQLDEGTGITVSAALDTAMMPSLDGEARCQLLSESAVRFIPVKLLSSPPLQVCPSSASMFRPPSSLFS